MELEVQNQQFLLSVLRRIVKKQDCKPKSHLLSPASEIPTPKIIQFDAIEAIIVYEKSSHYSEIQHLHCHKHAQSTSCILTEQQN